MRVELGLNQRSLRRWQIEAVRRLRRIPGLSLGIRWSKPVGDDLPSCIGTMLALERILHGAAEDLTAPALPTDLSAYVGSGGVDPDLVIDFSGGAPTAGRRRWRLTFDGGAGDGPILAALLEGRAPVIAISDAHSGIVVANARPGLREEDCVAAAFESVLARTVNLVTAAVRGAGTRIRVQVSPSTVSCGDVAFHGTRALAGAALARLSLLTKRPAHARTGWRFVTGPDVVDLGTHPPLGWQILPDDGSRSYTQPFPIVTRAERWLFLTERSFASGKSSISAIRFGPRGPLGTPAPVLELSSDISYPFVFEAEGNIWMIPQRAGATSIDLYRAARFPGGWRHEACIVPDVEASAPTPFRFGGRWWLSATIRDGGSDSDMLHLWSSEAIRGPWQPHPANPVLIDATAARPAGRIVDRGGRLIRPAQDRSPLGRGLLLAEILRLDDEGFEQRVLTRVVAAPSWPGGGASTLNRAGPIECIDGVDFAIAPHVPTRPQRLRPEDASEAAFAGAT